MVKRIIAKSYEQYAIELYNLFSNKRGVYINYSSLSSDYVLSIYRDVRRTCKRYKSLREIISKLTIICNNKKFDTIEVYFDNSQYIEIYWFPLFVITDDIWYKLIDLT